MRFVCLFGGGAHARSDVAEASGMAQKIVARTKARRKKKKSASGERASSAWCRAVDRNAERAGFDSSFVSSR